MSWSAYVTVLVGILLLVACIAYLVHMAKSDGGSDHFEEYLKRHQKKRD